jgi:hypothetical protein
MANFIWEDSETQNMLLTFAKDYIGAQHSLEIVEGASTFAADIAIGVIIGALTAGAGGALVVVGKNLKHIKRLIRLLGIQLKRLARALKKIKGRKKVKTQTNGKADGKLEAPKNLEKDTGDRTNLDGDKDGPDLNARATQDVHNVTAPIDFDGHILSGEVKPNGKVVGGHSIASGNVRVIQGTQSAPNPHGVYTAKIEVPDPDNPGQYLPKTNNNGFSTMFPDTWTADRVKVEVDAAFKNKIVTGNKWSGVTPSGVTVEGWLTPKTTVYPKY